MRNMIASMCAGAIALGFAASAQAAPIAFNFTQTGFTGGGVVTGMFVGDDLDGDGQLTGAFGGGEILDAMMSFSGNFLVPSFSLGFEDLFGLVYDLDGGPLGDGVVGNVEGIAFIGAENLYIGGPGPEELCGIGIDCAFVADFVGATEDFSQLLITVTPKEIPAPGTLALLGLGLAGLGLARRRRS